MKNIIIVGASRSGKTTLAKRLSTKLNISHYPFDAFVSTLEELYPEIGIKHEDDNTEMSKKLATLLQVFIKHMNYEKMNFLIDLYQIYPQDLKPILDKNIVAVYLGYPHSSPRQKLQDIKKYARPQDWTNTVSDEEMLEIIALFIKENKTMYNQSKNIGYRFFDTAVDFDQAIADAERYVIEELKR